MSRRSFLAGICLMMASPAAGSAQWTHAADVRRTVEAWRAEWEVPGAAVAVLQNGEVLLLEGFGSRRAGAPDGVDAHTLFELGSASKTFTATLAGLAVDQGMLEWTTPLTELLPTLRLGDPWLDRHVTLLDVLSHRSGFGRNDLLWLGGATPGEILERARHLEPSASFREAFSYSNLMYILAGEALGRLFGGTWYGAVSELILDPLGMRASLVGQPTPGSARAHPHVRIDDAVLPATTPPTHAGPAGGLLVSAESAVRWMRFHLEAEGAIRNLQEPRVVLPVEAFGAQYARASGLAYGAGWFVSDYAGRRMVDHIGGHGGMVANVTLLPDDGIGVAVLTNHGDNLLPVSVTYRILDLLLGLEERPWNDTLQEFWEGVRRMRAASAATRGGMRQMDAPSSLPDSAYVGRYASSIYGRMEIEQDGEGLLLRYGSIVGRLEHWHHDTFSVAWPGPMMQAILGPGFASFGLDMAGRASTIRVTGFQGEVMEAGREEGSR